MLFPDSDMRATMDALRNPRPGDRFTEMMAYWLYVLEAHDSGVVIMEANAPCELPLDGDVRWMTRSDFIERFVYETNPSKPWIRLVERGANIAGWLRYWVAKNGDPWPEYSAHKSDESPCSATVFSRSDVPVSENE